MDAPFLLEIFEKYGWIGVLVVVLSLIIWILLKFIFSKLTKDVDKMSTTISDRLSDSLAKQNESLVQIMNKQNDKLIDFLIKSHNDEQTSHSEMLENKMSISSDVTDKLKDITNYTNADRVSILEFHNSSNNLIGIPFAKFSCTYEWFKPGVVPLIRKLSNMQFSIIGSVIKDIFNGNKKYVIYESIYDLKYDNPALYYELEQAKVKSIIFFAMYDVRNCMLGVLSIEYHDKIHKDLLDINQITYDVLHITSLINLVKNNK